MLGQAGRALRSQYEGEVEAVGVEILRVEGPPKAPVCARGITKGRSYVEVGRWRPWIFGEGEAAVL